ncbi:MAG: hypothetical protein JKY27_07430, partial [Magnetovibrio sp.]|nr:hypothetical protein [Magnetovibrio sp.]
MTSYPNDELAQFFSNSLSDTDPALKTSIDKELSRQQNQIELIASENIVSKAVLAFDSSVRIFALYVSS